MALRRLHAAHLQLPVSGLKLHIHGEAVAEFVRDDVHVAARAR